MNTKRTTSDGYMPHKEREMTLYHRTTPENAAQINKTKKMISKENTGEVFLSNRKKGENRGYGESVVPVRVKAKHLRLDDEFSSGEKHYAAHHKNVIIKT
jgi:hypothetical protein